MEDYLSFYIITLAVFTVLDYPITEEFQHGYHTVNPFPGYHQGHLFHKPLVLMPMACQLILNLMKYPAVPSMAIGTVLLAVLVAVFYQGCPMREVVAGLNYGYAESPVVWSWWISFF